MSKNTLEVLECLDTMRPLEEYRESGQVDVYIKHIQNTVATLKGELKNQSTERQQIDYILDAFEKMIFIARHRAIICEAETSATCENADIFHVMGEVIEYYRNLLSDPQS